MIFDAVGLADVLCHSSECLYNLEMEYRHKIPTEKKHLPNFKDLYAKI
jgi:hypothetical protein